MHCRTRPGGESLHRRICRPVSAVVRVLWFIVFVWALSGSEHATADDWTWPGDDLSGVQTRDNRVSPWLELPRSAGLSAAPTDSRSPERDVRFRPVAGGSTVYTTAVPGLPGGDPITVPEQGEVLVIDHGEGFWSLYRSEDLRLSPSIFPARWKGGPVATTADSLYAAGRLTFAVLDTRSWQFVNPRGLLPGNATLPRDEMPVPGFRQGGEAVRGRNLRAGDAILVVPSEWLAPVTFPRRMYVLVDGLLRVDMSFLHPASLVDRVMETDGLRILDLRLPPGRTVIEIETHQFDGSVENRTIRLNIPDPVPLDTE